MKAIDYAQALYALNKKDTECKTIDGLVAVLKRRGSISLLPKILKEYQILLSKEKSEKPQIIISKTEDKETALQSLSNLPGSLRKLAMTDVGIVVDDTLVGGYIYQTRNILYDNSHKSALLGLYRKIVS